MSTPPSAVCGGGMLRISWRNGRFEPKGLFHERVDQLGLFTQTLLQFWVVGEQADGVAKPGCLLIRHPR